MCLACALHVHRYFFASKEAISTQTISASAAASTGATDAPLAENAADAALIAEESKKQAKEALRFLERQCAAA